MPKLSVSVPDDLWNDAKRVAGADSKTSQVVQQALQQFVREQDRVSSDLASRTVKDPRKFAEALSAAKAGYASEYQKGYDLVLTIVADIGYSILDAAVEMHFDLFEALNSLHEEEGDESRTVGHLGPVWDMHPDDERTLPMRYGATQALRDLWTALNAESDNTDSSQDDLKSES